MDLEAQYEALGKYSSPAGAISVASTATSSPPSSMSQVNIPPWPLTVCGGPQQGSGTADGAALAAAASSSVRWADDDTDDELVEEETGEVACLTGSSDSGAPFDIFAADSAEATIENVTETSRCLENSNIDSRAETEPGTKSAEAPPAVDPMARIMALRSEFVEYLLLGPWELDGGS